MKPQMSALIIIVMALIAPAFGAPQHPPAARQGACPPSLAELARKAGEARAKENLKNVPLYTNDNLPKGPGGLGIIGTNAPSASEEGNAEKAGPSTQRDIAYLEYQLNQAQQHLRMDQREVDVLQQQLSQSSMQYYPNPTKTLLQEYTRQNVNQLTEQVNQKKQQIAVEQKEVEDLQNQIWKLREASGASASLQVAASAVPPDVKPGSAAYWQARIAAAQQQLDSGREEQKLAENELSLLKLQQLRTLDPNRQSELAAGVSAKQQEVEAAKQEVEKAQRELEKVQKEAAAAGVENSQ